MSIRSGLGGASLALMLAACSGGSGTTAGVIGPGVGGGGSDNLTGPPRGKFDLANRCFTVELDGNAVRRATSGFTAAESSTGEIVKVYMKPTALGRYMFHTAGGDVLTGGADVSEAAPSDDGDWTFAAKRTGVYTATIAGGALAAAEDGALTVAETGGELRFVEAEGCEAYPEMPIDIGETFTGPAAGPLIGYADIHAHMSMGSDMSDGTGDRGPSAGGVMYGHAVNRFGVVEALKDCVDFHGPDGSTTAELVLDSAPDPHDTVGWPTFVDWPARDSQLHQQMYWKFVERSWRAGQRLMVLHGTSIEALCDVAKKTTGDKQSDCSDMGVGLKQVAYAYDMQDYIDAQYGGPGQGWYRIVKNPEEAERVIRAGKMAVVPGLEFSNIFKCNVTFLPGGEEVVGCDAESIDQQIEEAWDAGVRGIFLYHDVDSALGGTGIFSPVLNAVNYYGTKGWWETYACDDEQGNWSQGGEGLDNGYFYGAGAEMLGAGDYAPLLANPIGAALLTGANGSFPLYPPGNQCNARGITPLGEYALAAAMKKGFVLDIDHAEISIKQSMLDEGATTNPDYPMISAHGGHGGFTNAQVRQMLEQGGIMYPGMINGREYTGFYDKVEAVWNQMNSTAKAKYPIAVGYGADQNGLANQPGPRGMPFTAVDYTSGFALFEGDAWDPAFFGSLDPIPVEQLKIDLEGGRSWNVDEDGIAHYGMLPDMIEQIRIESGDETKYLKGFYRSADAYVRLWKQTVEASAKRPAPVAPGSTPPVVPHPIDPTTGPISPP